MNWQSLLNPKIQKFIQDNESQDVSELALKKPPNPDWDHKLILDQIKSRQKAKKKLPLWLSAHPNIILPAPSTLEQASSSATARYKASLVKGKTFVDLTGGAGIDCHALTEYYDQGICIERDPYTAELIEHNIKCLTDIPVTTYCDTAENYIKNMEKTDLVIIDPQRRDTRKRGKFKLEECSPAILEMLPALLPKADRIMVKTSPMLDIKQGITQLQNIHTVHIVEWNNDCKELIFIMGENPPDCPEINAVSINDNGEIITEISFTLEEENSAETEYCQPLNYLYEPGPAFQKSGGFNILAKRLNLKKLHPHTHLYTSDILLSHFPGRRFKIIDQYTVKSEKIPLKQAHITTRNFPSDVKTLRKKLKIQEGGDDYLFACTLHDETKKILHSRKI